MKEELDFRKVLENFQIYPEDYLDSLEGVVNMRKILLDTMNLIKNHHKPPRSAALNVAMDASLDVGVFVPIITKRLNDLGLIKLEERKFPLKKERPIIKNALVIPKGGFPTFLEMSQLSES